MAGPYQPGRAELVHQQGESLLLGGRVSAAKRSLSQPHKEGVTETANRTTLKICSLSPGLDSCQQEALSAFSTSHPYNSTTDVEHPNSTVRNHTSLQYL
jgi:hypothetical protein